MDKTKCLIALLGVLGSEVSLFAEFDANNRSINGTGETLAEDAWELGAMSAHYGITNDWMIQAPSAGLLVGYGRLEVKRRFRLDDGQRIAPYGFVETPKKFGFGSDYGWNWGDNSRHSLTLGARLQFTQRARGTTHGPRSRLHTLALPNAEYDYYANGNVSYAGIADYIPYFGHTWAFANWHIGLILSPQTSMIPLPYAYLRF